MDRNVIEITVKMTQEKPLCYRQLWLESKTDKLECNVYTTIGDTKLIVEINGRSYVLDISEFAGELVDKVIL